MDTVIKDLNQNWKFHYGECEEAWYKGFDDSAWRTVMLPHDWSVEHPFSREYSSGTGYLAGGIGWYRLRFHLPEEYRGKSIRVVFDGVYKNSQVWCNSYYLGKRPSGYTTFSYDLSSFAYFGEEDNEISVKVAHTDLADSRWFTGSGITRKVTLVIEEPVHPAEYGIVFRTREANGQSAAVEVTQEIINSLSEEVTLEIETALEPLSAGWDKKPEKPGDAGTILRGSIILAAGAAGKLTMEGIVDKPDLWSPKAPNLYRMRTCYRVKGPVLPSEGKSEEEGGASYLVHEDTVGIRTFCFDPDKGFFLNGEETKFKGVCVHHDGGCLGAAMKAEVWQRRLELLKESGCNAIRCSHNPHMPELYRLCDHMGFLMMDEAFDEWENAKNKWSVGHNVYPPRHQGYFEDFPKWHEEDLRAMVRRDRNHPSVILWSIGNEIDYPNDPYCHPMFDTMTGNNDANKPEAERRYDRNKPNAERLAVIARELAEIVRSEDTSRPVTLAAAFPELSARIGFLDSLDVVGYNYKEHLYEEDHKSFPDKPFLGSENGHSYSAWLAVKDNPYISGQFLWTGIDYLGEAAGWPVRGSRAGYITCAGFKKPEFYRRKSFWSGRDVLHIATRKADGRREHWIPMTESWNYEAGETILVKCYTNLPQIRLCLNGREIGRFNLCPAESGKLCSSDKEKLLSADRINSSPSLRALEFNEDGACLFEVPFEEGVLTAEGLNEEGGLVLERKLSSTKAAQQLDCRIWKQPDAITGDSWEAACAQTGYLYQLLFELQDEDGRITVWDDRRIKVTVTGAGELAGLESGNLSDLTPYADHERSTFAGKLAAYIRRNGEGRIIVTAEAEGCREATAVTLE